MSDPKEKKRKIKKRNGFEPISGKFGTPEAEKLPYLRAFFSSFRHFSPSQGGFVKLTN